MKTLDFTLSVNQCLIGLISRVFFRLWNAFSTLSFSKYAYSVSSTGRRFVLNIRDIPSCFSASSTACLFITQYLMYFFILDGISFLSLIASYILLKRLSFCATLSLSLRQIVRYPGIFS